jgi:hypothetical protein
MIEYQRPLARGPLICAGDADTRCVDAEASVGAAVQRQLVGLALGMLPITRGSWPHQSLVNQSFRPQCLHETPTKSDWKAGRRSPISTRRMAEEIPVSLDLRVQPCDLSIDEAAPQRGSTWHLQLGSLVPPLCTGTPGRRVWILARGEHVRHCTALLRCCKNLLIAARSMCQPALLDSTLHASAIGPRSRPGHTARGAGDELGSRAVCEWVRRRPSPVARRHSKSSRADRRKT